MDLQTPALTRFVQVDFLPVVRTRVSPITRPHFPPFFVICHYGTTFSRESAAFLLSATMKLHDCVDRPSSMQSNSEIIFVSRSLSMVAYVMLSPMPKTSR